MIAALLLFALGTAPALAKQPYASIGEIKEETKNGWHDTYIYKGETIQVDVNIDIPDVDKVAVVRVKWPEKGVQANAPAHADVTQYEREGFGYSVESGTNFPYGRSISAHCDAYRAEDARAENSPFSREEALAFAQEILAPYVEDAGTFSLQPGPVIAYSRLYRVTGSNRDGVIADYTKPICEMGYYDITFTQVFHGIPVFRQELPFRNPIRGEKFLEGKLLPGNVFTCIYSSEDYSIAFHPAVEDAVLAEDIPLAPFSKIQKEIERLIDAGYVRSVYWVRLQYVLMNDPDNPKGAMVLIPVWEVNGIMADRPGEPTLSLSEEETAYRKRIGERYQLINAQTGKWLDPNDTSPTRRNGTFLTWDEVK